MYSFRDRKLNIAILISASWHFVFMFTVAPVFISRDVKKNTTTIAFLGAILEKVAVVPEKALSLDKTSLMYKLKQAGEFNIERAGNTLASPVLSAKVSDVEANKEEIALPIEKSAVINVSSRKKDRLFIDLKGNMFAGEAKNRLVLYKPKLSKVYLFRYDFNSGYTVTVKFDISKDGFTERPECVLSSGSFVIDQAAIRYIRRWQFCPYYDETGASREALIRLNFSAL
ncbi:MAG: TonB family protein [Candidatus Omnitrophota bacterium]